MEKEINLYSRNLYNGCVSAMIIFLRPDMEHVSHATLPIHNNDGKKRKPGGGPSSLIVRQSMYRELIVLQSSIETANNRLKELRERINEQR